MQKIFWHPKSEQPKHKPGQFNQIIVYGMTSHGVSFSVCDYIDDGLVFSPSSAKIYEWSKCLFTHWAYLEELTPEG